ncbi:MAG TPA: hypothetical protein VK963_04520 [Candidatus Saccharimonadales bacterium]|nr:hypothetical protein [Candidatus Saccharimonadales bacterium]
MAVTSRAALAAVNQALVAMDETELDSLPHGVANSSESCDLARAFGCQVYYSAILIEADRGRRVAAAWRQPCITTKLRGDDGLPLVAVPLPEALEAYVFNRDAAAV